MMDQMIRKDIFWYIVRSSKQGEETKVICISGEVTISGEEIIAQKKEDNPMKGRRRQEHTR